MGLPICPNLPTASWIGIHAGPPVSETGIEQGKSTMQHQLLLLAFLLIQIFGFVRDAFSLTIELYIMLFTRFYFRAMPRLGPHSLFLPMASAPPVIGGKPRSLQCCPSEQF
jgi:hypothetical protein